MKVLLSDGNVATLPLMGGPKFELLNGEPVEGKCVVGEVAQIEGKVLADALRDERRQFVERRDLLREIRWIDKALVDVENGAEVGLKVSGSKMSLDIPEGARPDYNAGVEVGARVAVGPNISPKPLVNMHGEVVDMNGTRASVKVDEGDLSRAQRSTGKKFANPVSIPVASLEVIA